MWGLSGTVQYKNEDLETFVARIQKLAQNAYPDASEKVLNRVSIYNFLRGCKDGEAAIAASDKEPKTLQKAVQYVKRQFPERIKNSIKDLQTIQIIMNMKIKI
jgi:hypothetical protein